MHHPRVRVSGRDTGIVPGIGIVRSQWFCRAAELCISDLCLFSHPGPGNSSFWMFSYLLLPFVGSAPVLPGCNFGCGLRSNHSTQ